MRFRSLTLYLTLAVAVCLCSYASAAVAIVQTTGATSASSSSTRTQAFSTTPVLNDMAYLIVAVKTAAGTPGLPTVTDNYHNLWQLLGNSSSPANHIRVCFFGARITTTGATFTVSVAPAATAKLSITIAEASGYGLNSLPTSSMTLATGTSTAPTGSAMTVPSGATALLLGVCVNLGSSAVIGVNGTTQLFEDESTTNVASNSAYQVGVTATAPTMAWTFDSSQAWAVGSIAIYTADFPTTATHTSGLTATDYRLDARDISWASGLGINSSYGVTFSGGALVNYSGAIGTVMIAARIPPTGGGIVSADESTYGGDGGYNLIAGSNRTLSGQISTNLTDGNSDGVFSESTGYAMNGAVVIYELTFDTGTKTYRVRVNGWPVISGSYTGTPLTFTNMLLFGAAQGGVINSGATSATLYELRVWSSPQSTNVTDGAAIEMAWPFGPPITSRFFQAGFRNDTETATIASSNDGTRFVGAREISYAPPDSTVRDVGLYYHAANQTWYAFHTSGSFTGATYFYIAKFKDARLWIYHAKVDISGTVGIKPSVAPSAVVDAAGIIRRIIVEEVGATANYDLPVTDITAGTFGTATTITGLTGSDPFELSPSDRRNILAPTKYVAFTSTPNWKQSTLATGTFTGTNSIASGNNFEGSDPVLMDNGNLRVFMTGDPGFCYSDWNGSAWSSFAVLGGMNISTGAAFDVGQGDVVDRKSIGLYGRSPDSLVPTYLRIAQVRRHPHR